MLIQTRHNKTRYSRVHAFTLFEALIAITILSLAIGGIVYGYAQVNKMAQWSAMSAAAQSYALQGMEQARAAQWNPWDVSTNTGQWSENEITVPSVIVQQDLLDVPMKNLPYSTNAAGGFTNSLFFVTNYITVTQVTTSKGGVQFPANLRQIASVAYWTFPLYTNRIFSNTVITLRASDQ